MKIKVDELTDKIMTVFRSPRGDDYPFEASFGIRPEVSEYDKAYARVYAVIEDAFKKTENKSDNPDFDIKQMDKEINDVAVKAIFLPEDPDFDIEPLALDRDVPDDPKPRGPINDEWDF